MPETMKSLLIFSLILLVGGRATAELLSKSQVYAQLPSIVKAVEIESTRRFLNPPKVTVLDRFDESLVSQLAAKRLLDFGDVDDIDKLQDQLKFAEQVIRETFTNGKIAGFYDVAAKEVFILSYAIQDRCRDFHYNEEECNQRLLTIIAHELTHNLQYQYHPNLLQKKIERRDDKSCTSRGTKGCDIVTAVLEGQAILVQSQVAKAMGYQYQIDPLTDFRNSLQYHRNRLDEVKFAEIEYVYNSIYFAGYSFVKAVYDKYGIKKTWALLNDIPTSEEFSAAEPPAMNCLSALSRKAGALASRPPLVQELKRSN